ncbi:bifunctional 2-polyprenyl-6-hydroxyphenol methylase/3-demethylubiquinol 3-O-methyltransferase UbiG [Flavobacterium sp. J27]|uniref:class I SAM-dependent methyltransferase n=1 Tax=Flavobacterium sp. J27 TaxID=2060419 RepID=UPI001030CC1C|nr:methyltransferase domain-containing protein [Flavobacterium sp. J27]
MYNNFKRLVHLMVPKRMTFKIEPYLRAVFSITKRGKNHCCTICNFESNEWIIIENKDCLCARCGSLSRDRRLWNIISTHYLKDNIKVLDFSPSRPLYRAWKKQKNIFYSATDLSGDFIADTKYDITNIAQKTNSFDLILCYHILEHIIDDKKAMNELYRVLNPKGTILIQTPFKEGEIYEDYTITSEKERLKHFGQADHVRIYSVNGLKERLENVGFKIEILQFKKDAFLGFSDHETVLIAVK